MKVIFEQTLINPNMCGYCRFLQVNQWLISCGMGYFYRENKGETEIARPKVCIDAHGE